MVVAWFRLPLVLCVCVGCLHEARLSLRVGCGAAVWDGVSQQASATAAIARRRSPFTRTGWKAHRSSALQPLANTRSALRFLSVHPVCLAGVSRTVLASCVCCSHLTSSADVRLVEVRKRCQPLLRHPRPVSSSSAVHGTQGPVLEAVGLCEVHPRCPCFFVRAARRWYMQWRVRELCLQGAAEGGRTMKQPAQSLYNDPPKAVCCSSEGGGACFRERVFCVSECAVFVFS